jgi:hypothetical protein
MRLLHSTNGNRSVEMLLIPGYVNTSTFALYSESCEPAIVVELSREDLAYMIKKIDEERAEKAAETNGQLSC